jgi:hypothetical protein
VAHLLINRKGITEEKAKRETVQKAGEKVRKRVKAEEKKSR